MRRRERSGLWRQLLGRTLTYVALVAALALTSSLGRATPQPAAPFSEAQLIDGFMRTVFGEERPSQGSRKTARQVKKFVGPVRFHIVNTSQVERIGVLRDFLKSLSAAVDNLTFVEVGSVGAAQMVIFLSDRADYRTVIRNTVWEGVDTTFLEENACSAVFAARSSGIDQANIYLVADESFLALSHCMVEEIAQSLGPANDSSELPASIFNDTSELNVFGVFDWFILSMLYHPAVQPGMTEADVRPILPAVIADVTRRLPSVLESNAGALSHHHNASSAAAPH